jgi:hypothetical protein
VDGGGGAGLSWGWISSTGNGSGSEVRLKPGRKMRLVYTMKENYGCITGVGGIDWT